MSARRIRRDRQQSIEREERRLSFGKKATLAAGAGVGATVLFASAAQAATFTVNTLQDQDDNSCTDGDCSLRDAAYEANDNAGADTIAFATGLSGQINLTDTDGDIGLYEEVTVDGPGADVLAVSGQDTYRIFYINPGTNGTDYDPVTISGLTLRDGDESRGGALYADVTTLQLQNMVFDDNHSSGAAGAVYANDSGVYITDSQFTDNVADTNGGALYSEGTGSTTNEGEITITGSSFTNNEAGDRAGALDFSGDDPDGDVLIENSTFSGNTAEGNGGAIYIDETDNDASFTIRGSTINDNSAYYGGGAYLDSAEGGFLIENSTFSGNLATYNGGGIQFEYLYDDESTTVRNSTIVDNTAGTNPGNYTTDPYGGGGIYLYEDADSGGTDQPNGPVTLSSTIVANNTGVDIGPDLWQGSFTSGFDVSQSLIGDTSDAQINDGGNNLLNQTPDLGSLQDNGGPTQTLLPNLTSPVIDAGVANGLTTDQRGLPRTFDPVSVPNKPGSDGTDIGATELQAGENGLPGNGECQGAVVPSQTANDSGSVLTGTEGSDQLIGAAGDDTLSGLGANDCLTGEAGNDIADGGAGNDLVSGGDGNDTLKGVGGKDQLSGEGGKDKANGGAGKDKVTGGGGKDKLKGSGGKDKVSGGGGKDKINPGNGKDKVKAGGGKDKINTADGKKDKVNCGGGKDKATVDAKDKVKANCDVVKVKG